VRELIGAGRDPLPTVIAWVTDESLTFDQRLAAFNAVRDVMYPRLSAAVVQQNHTVTRVDSAELLGRLSERIGKLAAPSVIDGASVEQPNNADRHYLSEGEAPKQPDEAAA
jgi:hypothetical protein